MAVKVAIASRWVFTEPEEVVARFKQKEKCTNLPLYYDSNNHQFVLECPLLDSEDLSVSLSKVIQEYLHDELRQDMHQDGSLEVPRTGYRESEGNTSGDHNDVWDIIDRLYSEDKQLSSRSRLESKSQNPGQTSYVGGDLLNELTDDPLSRIGEKSQCDVVLDNISKSVGIIKRSEEASKTASKMSQANKETYRTVHTTSFDFFDDEGHADIRLRLVRSQNVADSGLFHSESAPLCEVTAVEWVSSSRQWKIARKEPIAVHESANILWCAPLRFQHMKAHNNPKTWNLTGFNDIKDSQGHSKLTTQQLGRTLKWASQISGDGDKSYTEDVSDEAMRSSATGNLNTESKRVRKIEGSDCNIANMWFTDDREVNKGFNCHGQKDNITSNEIGRNSPCKEHLPEFINFDKLKGGAREQGLISGKTWKQVNEATGSIMKHASLRRFSSITFELFLGRVFVYTSTVPYTELRPQSKAPADAFFPGDWEQVFRTCLDAKGACTLFSPKLTHCSKDINFLLHTKMGKSERMFESIARHREAWFEIHCIDPITGSEALIEIYECGRAQLEGVDNTIGSINFHYPSRTWDSCLRINTRDQKFAPEQENVFQDFINNAFVVHSEETNEDPELYSRANIEIKSARLVRETIHRVWVKELRLCLKHIKELKVEKLAENSFKALPPKIDESTYPSTVWWEAKIVAPSFQKMLEENKLYNCNTERWQEESIMYLRLMLQLSAHVVPRIDNIGFPFTREQRS